jgi:hypothetical protein
MRSAPLGSPARGVVCLGATRGRRQRPVSSALGRSRCHARLSLPYVWGRPGLFPTG